MAHLDLVLMPCSGDLLPKKVVVCVKYVTMVLDKDFQLEETSLPAVLHKPADDGDFIESLTKQEVQQVPTSCPPCDGGHHGSQS